ncbi:fibronectin type III domain-containing protein [Nocardioides nitrophenolicus]|uniref:fibronectin type III domain-containing protein n=1 Tax=Nocardioides nitrophenolicus TaxID=60489 RepID=UPI00195EA7BE|nr:fibronectin type III domain-containing protein [Nocardioides nitrophenolicus]MBM7517809.1 endonuclease/exonuclease/phosphatase family metal-dependent hydrolase [Nocardioides nitrophenolicus]
MRPHTPPRALRLLLVAIALLLSTTGLVAGFVEPASAAPKPAKVKGVKLKKPRVDGTTASFKVKWKRAARATSYKVQWRVPGGKPRKTRVRSTSTTIKGLAQGTDYCVKVRAYNGKRKGKWSKTRCRTTARLAAVQPVWVDRQQIQGSTVALTFRWNEVPGATSYDLDYLGNENPIQGAKNKQRVTVPSTGGPVAGVTIPGLDPGRTYCFQVRPSGPVGVGAFATAGCKVTVALSRATGGPLHVNMMTWNVCSSVCTGDRAWDLRKDGAKARLAAIAPDAVALQEATPAVDDLQVTPGYEKACQAGDGLPATPNVRNQSLLVKSSKFDVVAGTANGYRFPGYTHGGCWVRVIDQVTQRPLILAGLHLAPPAQASDAERDSEMRQFLLAIQADPNTAGVPILFAGDFNSDRTRGSDAPRQVLNSLGYDDAFDAAEAYNSLPYVNSWNAWAVPPPVSYRWGAHVDRVFAPPAARVTSWQMESPFAGSLQLSDHSPVRVTVEIP